MLTAIGDVFRHAYDKGHISVRDGNISLHRKNSNVLYITPSGVRKTIIHPESIIKRKWVYDDRLQKTHTQDSLKGVISRPRGELELHEQLQRNAVTTRAVVHLHSTHIIACMLKGFELNQLVNMFPELGRYTTVAPNVGILPPISHELAMATYRSMTGQSSSFYDGDIDMFKAPIFDVVGLGGHGVVAVSSDPWSGWEAIERLDHVCQIVLLSGMRPKDL